MTIFPTKKANWCSLAIYSNNIEKILNETIAPFLEQYKSEINLFFFNRSRERGENLILIFNLTGQSNDLIKVVLKEKITNYLTEFPAPTLNITPPVNDWFLPFQNNHIEFNGNFLFDIIETGGLEASYIGQELLSSSSELLLDFFDAYSSEEWIPDEQIGLAIQVQLALISAFMTPENTALFYSNAFENITAMIQTEQPEDKINLLEGLAENYAAQEEGIGGFIASLSYYFHENEEFDDEWLNDWYSKCQEVAEKFLALQKRKAFFAPEDFEYNTKLTATKNEQELWPVIEYFARAINSQIGITDGLELNLMYILKKSTEKITLEDA